jgi:hypothetical protein
MDRLSATWATAERLPHHAAVRTQFTPTTGVAARPTGFPLPRLKLRLTILTAATAASWRGVGTMPTVTCPGCSRSIPLSFEELALTIECARCGTRFAAGTGEIVHPPEHAETPAPQVDAEEEELEAPLRAEQRATVCPDCSRTLLVPTQAWGCRVECPACDSRFVAREPAPPASHDPDGPGPGEVRCPLCNAVGPPAVKSQVTAVGWFVVVSMLCTCFPLAFLGLLIREPVQRCAGCGLKLKPGVGYPPGLAPDTGARGPGEPEPVRVAGYWRRDGTYVPVRRGGRKRRGRPRS